MIQQVRHRNVSATMRSGMLGLMPNWAQHLCVHELFEAQAVRTPDSVAISCGEKQLTYGELNARANQLARTLFHMTSGMDVPIGICLERSLEMAIGVLAVLKAGAAYLPLDPEYPRDVLRQMLDSALVPVVLTQTAAASRIPETRAARLFVDRSFDEDDANLQRRISPGNLACVIYTSGSTGIPKAVAMPHRPLVNLLAWHGSSSAFMRPANTLQFASLSFELSFQEMFSTWCTGGTLFLIPEETRLNPFTMLEFLENQRIERAFFPFSALLELAETSLNTQLAPRYLRDIVSTGEQLRICPKLAEFFENLRSCRLHNHYSLSESHVAATYTLTGSPRDWPLLPPIGKPITNVRIHLLDHDRRSVPPGESGEIFISGESLAQGYLYRPALTAERFVVDRSAREGPVRLYRTGDIGRLLECGNVEFLGRSERQVKIRGARVEPSTVDAFLSQHPCVRACVTVASGSNRAAKRLCSYIVPRAAQPSVRSLRKFLRDSLPDYLIPSQFGFLDALPLTPNGKVDQHRLPVLKTSHRAP